MSWDLIVQDLPAGVDNVDDVPEDYVPKVIGRRSEIIAKIMEVAPMADFSDPSWGVIDSDGFSMEVSMGDEEECEGFALHIRGGDAAIGLAADIIDHLGLRAFDPQSDTGIFRRGPEAEESLRRWRAYRDRFAE